MDHDHITDINGQPVFTGTVVRGDDPGHALPGTVVCIGRTDPGDGGDPEPILLLDAYMAHELASQLAALADAHLGPPPASGARADAADADADHHHYAALTGRLLLARLTDNLDAWNHTADDLGDCPHCWGRIASQSTAIAAGAIVAHHGHDGAIEFAETLIARSLDHDGKEDQP